MSVIFLSQTSMMLLNWHSHINTECVMDASAHIDHNCPEDMLTSKSAGLKYQSVLFSLICATHFYLISGIQSSLWQPPE